MRISRFLAAMPAVFLIAACGEDAPPPAPEPVEEPDAEVVECAVGNGSEFGAECPVERTEIDGENVLVVHHPGGGFRRFTLASDGSGLTAYDGADTAQRTLDGDMLEIAIGTDRYRFPARPVTSSQPESDAGS